MSRREIPHLAAMSSAPWNWLTGASPYRARQPAEPHEGPLREAERFRRLPGGEGDRDHRHVLRAARDDQVLGSGEHALRREVDRLLRGAALPVDGDAGDLLGQAYREPCRPGDVARLGADRVQAAEDHVLHRRRVHPGPLHQGPQDVRAEVGGVDGRQASPAPPHGRAYRVDYVGLGHGDSSGSGQVRRAIPSSTIDRYWRAISSGLCCPPGRYQEAATHTVSRTKR